MANERARSRVIPEHRRHKLTGRKSSFSFLRLPNFMLESKEWAALSANAVKLLLDMAKLYRGNNNGNLSMAWSRLCNEGWSSENTMRRARIELLAAGFLICTRQPLRKRCGLYAISWEPIDECPGKFLEVKKERVASQLWRNEKQNRNSHGGGKSPSGEDQQVPFAATTDA